MRSRRVETTTRPGSVEERARIEVCLRSEEGQLVGGERKIRDLLHFGTVRRLLCFLREFTEAHLKIYLIVDISF